MAASEPHRLKGSEVATSSSVALLPLSPGLYFA